MAPALEVFLDFLRLGFTASCSPLALAAHLRFRVNPSPLVLLGTAAGAAIG